MKNTLLSLTLGCILFSTNVFGQKMKLSAGSVENVSVHSSQVNIDGKTALRITKDPLVVAFDEPTFSRVKGVELENGIIEVSVLSRLLPDAPEFSRGFIGVAFRINDSNSEFESIYVRPSNGRANDQVRRNHTVQYFSFPNYKFDRLRKESPEKYESYADIGLNEWIDLKIVVKDSEARLFINGNKQPSLIVNDLKHGNNRTGAIGLWVDVGTEGFFKDLKITKE